MKKNKASTIAVLAIFIAIMIVIQLLSQIIYGLWPVPIKPTLLHIPVIIGSVLFGWRKGAFLGFVMGLISFLNATLVTSPSSFMFSPLQPIPGTNHGSPAALLIAFVPRILIGILPYFVYQMTKKSRWSASLAGFAGTATNTVLVLFGIFLFFHETLKQSFGAFITSIVSINSLVELVIAVILCSALLKRMNSTHLK